MTKRTPYRKTLHALSVVEQAYHHAIGQRKSMKHAAGEMYDDWGKKVDASQGDELRRNLLERRLAALVASKVR